MNSWEQERNDREKRERKRGTNLKRPAGGKAK
jgi:hypothetical protein